MNKNEPAWDEGYDAWAARCEIPPPYDPNEEKDQHNAWLDGFECAEIDNEDGAVLEPC